MNTVVLVTSLPPEVLELPTIFFGTSLHYTNGFGNITAIDYGSAASGTWSSSVRRNFRYDAFDRLEYAEQIGGRFPLKETYSYDAIGNLQSVATQHTSRPASNNTYTYSDKNNPGRLSAGTFEGQPFAIRYLQQNGSPTGLIASKSGPNNYSLTYDAHGRVITISAPNTSSNRSYGPNGFLSHLRWTNGNKTHSIHIGLHGYETEAEPAGGPTVARIKVPALLGTVILQGLEWANAQCRKHLPYRPSQLTALDFGSSGRTRTPIHPFWLSQCL